MKHYMDNATHLLQRWCRPCQQQQRVDAF